VSPTEAWISVITPFRRRPDARPGDIQPFLQAAGPAQRYPRGTEFFSQGGESEAVFLITGGLVKLLRCCPDGRAVIVGLRSPGWILGGAAAVLGDPYTVTACAVTPCEALRLHTGLFHELIRTNVEVSGYVHRLHAMEVGSGLTHLGDFGNLSARQRLEGFLCDLAHELPPSPDGVEIPLRDWEIAQLVAITPPYLSRLVQELTLSGRLERQRNVLILHAPKRRAGPPPLPLPDRPVATPPSFDGAPAMLARRNGVKEKRSAN
jgi:CRP-like cAMP-binding protein